MKRNLHNVMHFNVKQYSRWHLRGASFSASIKFFLPFASRGFEYDLKLSFFQQQLAGISRKLYYTNIGYFCISTTRHKVQATPSHVSTSNSIKVHLEFDSICKKKIQIQFSFNLIAQKLFKSIFSLNLY